MMDTDDLDRGSQDPTIVDDMLYLARAPASGSEGEEPTAPAAGNRAAHAMVSESDEEPPAAGVAEAREHWRRDNVGGEAPFEWQQAAQKNTPTPDTILYWQAKSDGHWPRYM